MAFDQSIVLEPSLQESPIDIGREDEAAEGRSRGPAAQDVVAVVGLGGFVEVVPMSEETPGRKGKGKWAGGGGGEFVSEVACWRARGFRVRQIMGNINVR